MIRSEVLEGGAVLRLVLSRPKANLLDLEMLRGIGAALDAEVQAGTKLVIFEGAGAHFSFGASVQEHERARAPEMLETFHGLFKRLGELAVPTCALVRGQCLGGGLELVSWCTMVAASPEARLGQPEIQLGVFAPMASILLPWRIGGGPALDLLISGRPVTADEALRLRLVDAVTENLEGWWRSRYEAHLAGSSAVALRFAERAARASLMASLQRELPEVERLYLEGLMSTHDANEGIAAFLEKRRPDYQNR
jgi:cyclohexa-1,5-dienecarbonyl-CoA hydratase